MILPLHDVTRMRHTKYVYLCPIGGQIRKVTLVYRFRSDVGGLMKACFKSSSHPNSLKQYLTYVYGLDYETPPDYKKTRQMFVRELSSLGLRDDGKELDWAAPGVKVSDYFSML